MRILFLSNLYPPNDIGGYEQQCQEVAIALLDRGHQVRVLTSRYGLQTSDQSRDDYVTRTLFLESDLNFYRPIDYLFKHTSQLKANEKELNRFLNEYNPEIVVVWGLWNLSMNLPFWLENRRPNRVVYYVASYWPSDIDPHRNYWNLPTKHPQLNFVKKPLSTMVNARLNQAQYPEV